MEGQERLTGESHRSSQSICTVGRAPLGIMTGDNWSLNTASYLKEFDAMHAILL